MANYAGLWFPGQLPVFLIGMMVFYVARGLHNKFDPGALEIALAVCVTFILIAPMKMAGLVRATSGSDRHGEAGIL